MRVRQAQIFVNPWPSSLLGEGGNTPPVPLRSIAATRLTGAGVPRREGHRECLTKITIRVGLVFAQQEGVPA